MAAQQKNRFDPEAGTAIAPVLFLIAVLAILTVAVLTSGGYLNNLAL